MFFFVQYFEILMFTHINKIRFSMYFYIRLDFQCSKILNLLRKEIFELKNIERKNPSMKTSNNVNLSRTPHNNGSSLKSIRHQLYILQLSKIQASSGTLTNKVCMIGCVNCKPMSSNRSVE